MDVNPFKMAFLLFETANRVVKVIDRTKTIEFVITYLCLKPRRAMFESLRNERLIKEQVKCQLV
jgi:hypothetical protein